MTHSTRYKVLINSDLGAKVMLVKQHVHGETLRQAHARDQRAQAVKRMRAEAREQKKHTTTATSGQVTINF